MRVLTFNIRYGTANDGAHRWPNRSAHVIATIRDHAPHLLGIQESLRFQLDELGRALPGYRELGVGRDDGKTAGEYAAILVDTTRFAIVTHGHFWFSETPDIPSKTWGNNVIRICTWARLADRVTGDTIRVYNSHWDHESQPSRVESAKALLQRVAADRSAQDRVLVMGDFNTDEENPAFRMLTSDNRVTLRDTFRALHAEAKHVGTFNSFRGDSTTGKIDAILVTPNWEVLDASIDRRRFGELWASDHFAVSATLRAERHGVVAAAFEPMELDLFARGARVAAWADYDGDGDLDLFGAFNDTTNRLYVSQGNAFTYASQIAIARGRLITAAAWGDFDADGDPDLVVAAAGAGPSILVYRNDRGDFRDVTRDVGVAFAGATVTQLAWIDYDHDRDLDLFIAFRDRANVLLDNASNRLSLVRNPFGAGAARRTSGAVWFDANGDARPDLLVANTDGDANSLYLGGMAHTFSERARAASLQGDGRRETDNARNAAIGATRQFCLGDVTGDGTLDIFMADTGTTRLMIGPTLPVQVESSGPPVGIGTPEYADSAKARGIALEGSFDACAMDDFDNDGRVDLFVSGTPKDATESRNFLFRNTGSAFVDATPESLRELPGATGAQWVDFDRDGAVDLVLTANDLVPTLVRNLIPTPDAMRSLSVTLMNSSGRAVLAGAVVRLYDEGTRRVVGVRVMDAGIARGAQSEAPMHFGLPTSGKVDVHIVFPVSERRGAMTVHAVEPALFRGRSLVVRLTTTEERR